MSETDVHAPFNGFTGRIGKLVYKRYKGRTVVSHVPDPKRTLTPKEIAHREKFTKASWWAKDVFQDEEIRAFYEALAPNMVFIKKGVTRKGTTPRSAAITDYLVGPSIVALDVSEYNGQTGDQMYFAASDNVGVNRAKIQIHDADGNHLETGFGDIADAEKGTWTYTARLAIPAGTSINITLTVYDRPGNSAEISEAKTL